MATNDVRAFGSNAFLQTVPRIQCGNAVSADGTDTASFVLSRHGMLMGWGTCQWNELRQAETGGVADPGSGLGQRVQKPVVLLHRVDRWLCSWVV